MTLIHPEPGFRGHLSFSFVNSTEIALDVPIKRIFYDSGRIRQFMLETRKVDNNPQIRKALFVNLRPLYVTDALEKCSGSGRVVLFIVQWFLKRK